MAQKCFEVAQECYLDVRSLADVGNCYRSIPRKTGSAVPPLSHNGVTLHGIARGRAPHQQIEYSYEINGQTYQGVGRTGIGSPSLYEISIGDKVPVYFLPDAPEISCLGDPAELYSNDLPPTLLVSLLFPTAIVIALAVRISRKRLLS